MKHRVAVILLAIVALAASPTYAQVTGGLKIGVNFADVSVEDDEGEEEFDTRTGLVIGGYVEVPVGPVFSFQPEFLYSQKGAKFEDFDFGDVTIKYDQIQIPLLARFNFGVTDAPVRGFVVTGPGLGFAVKREIDVEDEAFDDFDEELDDELESFDFSWIIGAGVQFGMATVEVRYDHGLRNLDSFDEGDFKSKTISVLFGIGFGR